MRAMQSDTHSDGRTPRSGKAALAAGALVQAVLGTNFLLAGLSKFADSQYVAHFDTFVKSSPGSHRGIISSLINGLVLPHAEIAAQLARFTEVVAGLVLVVAAVEVARRWFGGRIGAQRAYEPVVAAAAVAAGLTLAGLSLTIYLVQGGTLPGINPAKAFASAITVELMIIPVALAIAWMEFGRYAALSGRFVPTMVKRLV